MIDRIAFIYAVKAPMHHCSKTAQIILYTRKNVTAKTDQTK